MAYDSATDTALASQAYQRALAVAAQRRGQLNTQFGLNADGSMNNTAAGHLGSIYQTNDASVAQDEQAELVDRRRGFGTGGLGGKATARTEQSGLQRQALGLQDATQQLGAVTQDEQAATQQNQYDLSNIGSKSAYDLATTLAANPVLAPDQLSPFSNPQAGNITPAQAAAQKKALAANPRAAQVARNRF